MSRLLLLSILLVCVFVQNAGCQTDLQSDRIIPVYPGAVLKTEQNRGDSKMCCTFTTNDSFEKVVTFYEKSLNLKSVDPDGLAAQIPSLRTQVDLMKKELQPGMKIKFFILKVVEFQGQKGAETFEVVDPGSGEIEFSIMDSQLSETDSHFASEWEGMGEAAGDTPRAKSSDVKKLVSALPDTGPTGFVKSEINISDDPYSPSYVGVDFSKGMEYNINVTITDYAGFNEDIKAMIEPLSDNEKSVVVKGKFPGKETLTKLGDFCGGADKIFMVKERYLVVISAMKLCDFAILNQMIDRMNLDSLQK
jgi:hypothetical protein